MRSRWCERWQANRFAAITSRALRLRELPPAETLSFGFAMTVSAFGGRDAIKPWNDRLRRRGLRGKPCGRHSDALVRTLLRREAWA